MIGTAAGLASKVLSMGLHDSSFFIEYEFVRNLIAFQNLNVNLVGVGSGLALIHWVSHILGLRILV